MIKAFITILIFFVVGCAGPKGDAGTKGLPGAKGTNGTNGAVGATGAAGERGPAGTPGVDAPQLVVVQLCPGETIYPSVFIEQALCINHKLVAVYSDKGGYLFNLVPGRYSSNAVGSRCDFTVGENCEVTPELRD